MTVAVEPAVEAPGTPARNRARRRLARSCATTASARRPGEALRLEQGHTLAVFGPNGAGRRRSCGCWRRCSYPTRERCACWATSSRATRTTSARQVGLLAHDPLLYRISPVRENLRFYARLYGVEEPEARIAHLLESTGMTTRSDEPVRNLARDGAADRDLPCGAASARAAAAGRAARSPRPGSRRNGGALIGAHTASHESSSRTRSSMASPRPTTCSACERISRDRRPAARPGPARGARSCTSTA